MNSLEQMLYDSAQQAQEVNRLINEILSKSKTEEVILNANGETVPSLARRVHLYLSSLVASGALDGEDAIGLSTAKIDASGNLIIDLTNGISLNLGRVEGKDGKSVSNAAIVGTDLVITLDDGTNFNVGRVVGADGVNVTKAYIDTGRLKVDLSDGSTIDAGDVTQFGGVAAQDADITNEGDLVVVYTDGTVENVGRVVGAKGANGLNVVTAYVDGKGQLNLLMSNGDTIIAGKVSKTVIDGTTKSVQSATISTDPATEGHLIITLSDGTTIDTGRVTGLDGTNGIDGADGKDITNASINTTGELVFDFSDGSTLPVGMVKKTVIDASNVSIADATKDPNTGVLTLTVWDGSNLKTYDLGVIDGKDGVDGVDGVGITAATFNGDTLTFTMSDGSTMTAGDVDRSVLTSANVDQTTGELILTYTRSDATTFDKNVGVVRGVDGVDGVSVSNVTMDASGLLTFTFSDGNTVTTSGSVFAPTETNAALSGNDLVITLSDGSQKTFTGIVGTDGTDGDTITGVSFDNTTGTFTFTASQSGDFTTGPVSRNIKDASIDSAGDLNIELYDGTIFPCGNVVGTDGADGKDGASVSSIEVQSESLIITLEDGSQKIVSDIVGADGTDGVGVTTINFDGTDLLISLSDSSTVTVPAIKGVDGVSMDSVTIDANDNLVFTMSDGTITQFSGLAGQDGISIDTLSYDGTNLNIALTDGTSTSVPMVKGEDGRTITNMAFDGTNLNIDLSDSTSVSIPSVKGVDAVGIDTMVSTDTDVTTTLTDGTTTSIPYSQAVDGVGIVDATIDLSDRLVFDMTDGTTIDAGQLGRGIDSANVNTDGELELMLTDGTVLVPGVVKATDGTSMASASIDANDDVSVTLTDGTVIPVGNISRIEVSSIDLSTGDLIITLSDSSTINAGRVNGLDGRYVTGATIDANEDLTFQMRRDGDILVGNVMGSAGLAIDKAEVFLNGDLVITYTDGSTERAGNVGSGAGLTLWETGNSYQQDRVVVHNGGMYIALVDGATTEPPSTEWRAFAFGDEITEIRKPTIVSPSGTAENLNPDLVGSPFAPIVSGDPRDYREFQVDVSTGDFSAPIYTAQENSDSHEVATALTSGSAYIWRCRDVSALTGYISDWSDSGSFTTPTAYIDQPVVSLDSNEDPAAASGATAFTSSPFAVTAGTGSETHVSTDWQVIETAGGTVVSSSLADTINLTSWYVPMGDLSPSTEYQVQVRYNSSALVSAWSAAVTFTTEASFDYLGAPSVAYSGRDATQASTTPRFLSTPLSVLGGYTDTHVASDWEVVRKSDGVMMFSSYGDTTNLQDITVSPALALNETYQARVRYQAERFGWTAWSNWQDVTTAAYIDTPVISTTEDVNAFPLDGLVSASAFYGVNDTHVSTDWQVVQPVTQTVVWESLGDTTNLESVNVNIPADYISSDLLIRVRFNGSSVTSDWSTDLSVFTISIVPINSYSGSYDDTVKKIDPNGSEVWTFSGHTNNVWGVAVDSSGNVYSGSQDDTVKKIDPNGSEVWTFSGHTNNVYSVAVDSSGNVYSGSYDQTVKKIDPNGNEVWTFSGHTSNVWGVAVDSSGNVYSGSSDQTVKKIDPNGTEIWTFSGHTNAVNGVAVDSSGNVYSGSSDQTVKKIDPNGTEIWTFSGHTNVVRSVAVDSSGNVYSGSYDQTVKKIDPNGTEIWTFSGHTNVVRSVAVDSSGNVYSGAYDNTVKKIDPDGAEVWTFSGHTNYVMGVAVDQH